MARPDTATQSTNWTGVGYGIALGFVAAYFQFKVPPVLPVLLDRHGYDSFVAGGFMSIFAVAGMLVSVRVGRAIRERGAVAYLAGAFVLMIAGSLLGLAWPESGIAVLVSRTIEGLGAAVLAVCMGAFANMKASPTHLPLIIAVQATWIPVGQLLANLVAQPSVARGMWEPVWWAGIAMTVALALATAVLARSHALQLGSGRPSAPADEDGAKAAQPSAGVGHSREEAFALKVAAVLFFAWQAQFMGYFTWLNVYLVDVRGYTADGAVLVNQVPVVVLLLFCLAAGFVMRAGVGAPRLLIFSLSLQTVGWLLVPFAQSDLVGLISLVVWGVAAGITPSALWALPSTLLGGHRAGTDAFAVVLTGRYLGILAGPLIGAGMQRLTGDWTMVPWAFVAMALVTVAFAVWFDRLATRLKAT